MRKLIILISLILICSQAHALTLHRRLQVYLENSNSTRANQIKTLINSNITASDKWTGENKNIDVVVAQGSETSPTVWTVSATYLFNNDQKALDIYNLIVQNLPVGTTGRVSLHYCPVEGSATDWQGCKNDARADYRETKF